MQRTAVAGFFRVASFGMMIIGGVIFFLGQGAEGEGKTGVYISSGVFFMIGVIWWLVGTGVGAYYEKAAKRLAADRRLFETGEVAVAVIERVEPTATSINNMPVVKVTVRVEPKAGSPFSHTEKIVTPPMAVPLPGHRIRVAFDPVNTDDVALETQPGFDAPPGVVLATMPPDAAGAAQPADTDADEADPHLDRLERLAKLHEAGVLTDAEFADQKARILDER